MYTPKPLVAEPPRTAEDVAAYRRHLHDGTRRWRKANPERDREIGRTAGAKRRVEHPDYARAARLKSEYGITIEDYDAMASGQGNVCASCGQPETRMLKGKIVRLCIDHCHETGKIRGLLCGACNLGLGQFGDDPDKLRAILAYLEREGA